MRLSCAISRIVLEVLTIIFAAAVSLVALCFAALTIPNAPEPAVPWIVKSHGDGVAETSGGGTGCERYDAKYVFRLD
jgi:hypothetical protein